MRNVGVESCIMSILYTAIVLACTICCGLLTPVSCQQTTTVGEWNITTVHAIIGGSAHLSCDVEHNRTVVWRTPQRVTSGNSVRVSFTNKTTHGLSTASIRHVSLWHAGLYTCLLSDGVILHNFTLTVSPDPAVGVGSLFLYVSLGCMGLAILGAIFILSLYSYSQTKPAAHSTASYAPGVPMSSANVTRNPGVVFSQAAEQKMSPPPAAPPRPASSLEPNSFPSLYSSNYQALRGVKPFLTTSASDDVQAIDSSLVNSPSSWRSCDTHTGLNKSKNRLDDSKSNMSYFKSVDVDDGCGYHDLSTGVVVDDFLPPNDISHGQGFNGNRSSVHQSRNLSQRSAESHSESLWSNGSMRHHNVDRLPESSQSKQWQGSSAREAAGNDNGFLASSASIRSRGSQRFVKASDVETCTEQYEMDEACDQVDGLMNRAPPCSPRSPRLPQRASMHGSDLCASDVPASAEMSLHSNHARSPYQHSHLSGSNSTVLVRPHTNMPRTSSLHENSLNRVSPRDSRSGRGRDKSTFAQARCQSVRTSLSPNLNREVVTEEFQQPFVWRPNSPAAHPSEFRDDLSPIPSPTPSRNRWGSSEFELGPQLPPRRY